MKVIIKNLLLLIPLVAIRVFFFVVKHPLLFLVKPAFSFVVSLSNHDLTPPSFDKLRTNGGSSLKINLFAIVLGSFLLSACQQSEPEQLAEAEVIQEAITTIEVYRSPTCNCCHKWINHLEENKFSVIDKLTQDMASVKEAVKLPKQMASCHTAIIDGYIIEGHVPAADITRLLAEKPDIAGLSVPQMPIGTPGMEMGERKDPYIVFQFNKTGQYSVFSEYQPDDSNQYQHKAH